jgi:deoxyadenosine/deoxycytidine kinase
MNHLPEKKLLHIGVVGPCAAGKSTLVDRLRQNGYRAKNIGQEHSYVKDMWQRITNPDLLIFLDVSYPLTIQRRKMDWSESEYAEQIYRLRHAREHASLIVKTDELSADQVLQIVLDFLILRNSVGQSPRLGV